MKITNKEFAKDHARRNAERKLYAENKMSNKAFVLWCILWFFSASLIVYKTITL